MLGAQCSTIQVVESEREPILVVDLVLTQVATQQHEQQGRASAEGGERRERVGLFGGGPARVHVEQFERRLGFQRRDGEQAIVGNKAVEIARIALPPGQYRGDQVIAGQERAVFGLPHIIDDQEAGLALIADLHSDALDLLCDAETRVVFEAEGCGPAAQVQLDIGVLSQAHHQDAAGEVLEDDGIVGDREDEAGFADAGRAFERQALVGCFEQSRA